MNWINPFCTNVLFLYPLKTSQNLWFSDVFREYRNGTLAWKGLIWKYCLVGSNLSQMFYNPATAINFVHFTGEHLRCCLSFCKFRRRPAIQQKVTSLQVFYWELSWGFFCIKHICVISNVRFFNPLMSGGSKKVTQT